MEIKTLTPLDKARWIYGKFNEIDVRPSEFSKLFDIPRDELFLVAARAIGEIVSCISDKRISEIYDKLVTDLNLRECADSQPSVWVISEARYNMLERFARGMTANMFPRSPTVVKMNDGRLLLLSDDGETTLEITQEQFTQLMRPGDALSHFPDTKINSETVPDDVLRSPTSPKKVSLFDKLKAACDPNRPDQEGEEQDTPTLGHYVWVVSEDLWWALSKTNPKAISPAIFSTTAVVLKTNDGRLMLVRHRNGTSGGEITKDQLHTLIHTGMVD
jgi:hypothetical protein